MRGRTRVREDKGQGGQGSGRTGRHEREDEGQGGQVGMRGRTSGREDR